MSKEAIAIKGILGGLAIIVNPQIDLNIIGEELTSKLAASKGFFRGAYFTVAPQEKLTDQVLGKLVQIAEDFGLIYSQSLVYNMRTSQAANHGVETMAAATLALEPETTKTFTTTPVTDASGLSPQELQGETLLINQSLRSGQHINFDGNVVILGDVNPGAEVIASGSIVVMGTLRGIVHAGASGDPKSKIVAYRLLANQIRIGNQIGRSPDDKAPTQVALVPEQARLGQEGIILEQYVTTKRVTAM